MLLLLMNLGSAPGASPVGVDTDPLRRDYWRAKKLPGAIEYYVGNDGARDARRGRWARVVGWLSTALGRERPLVGDDQGRD